ncbi:alpha-galactosidase [Qipengyuania sphaerica]|uniref:alpha-galactosidase n=1 Tax=Qipengyuania sphaerica TaxID=2867243 RepID=UPI001C87F234|nr:alpha-galactosidase [Qipengyuania sphaerica]MBX7541236.1 alpha-galactosidase [Qipengyuania sphaerica]
MRSSDIVALHSGGASLVLEAGGERVPLWRHLGLSVDARDIPSIYRTRGRATFSMDADRAPDILPLPGDGSFLRAALLVCAKDGKALDLILDCTGIESGHDRLTCDFSDKKHGLEVRVDYRAVSGGFRIETSLENRGSAPLSVQHLASCSLPLPARCERIISWRGRHNAEFVECVEPMPQHGWSRETRRGLTGHGGPCGAYVLADGADHHSGLVFAAQLAWSGDSRIAIERDDEGFWTLQAEALIKPGEVTLEPGSSHSAPPVLLAISDAGRNGAMAIMHAMARAIARWPGGEMTPRPVHSNSWEAVYFAHDEKRIGELAEAAAAIGAERFVLDDGWFSGRGNDTAGLGDWIPDPAKYPDGLARIAERVRGLGMEFGLWVEPEMVNPESDLYRAHPDWALAIDGREPPTARNQLVLDMRREDVRDHLFERLDAILRSAPISYLKLDHNRDHSPSGGSEQIRGSYELFARLREAHPEVEIESCAGGGGRIDAGVLEYVHRFWTSDNIDALARIPMQRGFLAFMPPEFMGAHVGASPSHATGRVQSLDFRAAIACQGHFGIELDPAAMEQQEREKLAGWVRLYKEWRHLIHGGKVLLGEANDGLVWQAQGTDDELLLWVTRAGHAEDRRAQPVPLSFAKGADWQVRILRSAVSGGVLTPRATPFFHDLRDKPHGFAGSWLAHSGLPVPALPAESAMIFHLKAQR